MGEVVNKIPNTSNDKNDITESEYVLNVTSRTFHIPEVKE